MENEEEEKRIKRITKEQLKLLKKMAAIAELKPSMITRVVLNRARKIVALAVEIRQLQFEKKMKPGGVVHKSGPPFSGEDIIPSSIMKSKD